MRDVAISAKATAAAASSRGVNERYSLVGCTTSPAEVNPILAVAPSIGLDSDWLNAGPTDLPFHFDWIPTLRALTQILRWLQRPDLDELTPYMRASESRRLVKRLEADLRNVGVPLGLYTSLGPEFWNDFTAIVLLLLRKAQGQA